MSSWDVSGTEAEAEDSEASVETPKRPLETNVGDEADGSMASNPVGKKMSFIAVSVNATRPCFSHDRVTFIISFLFFLTPKSYVSDTAEAG